MNRWAVEERAKIIAQLQEKTGTCVSVKAKLPSTGVGVNGTLGAAMVEMKPNKKVSTQLVSDTYDVVGPEIPQKTAGVQDQLVEDISSTVITRQASALSY